MTKNEILLAHQKFLFPAVFHYFDQPLVLDHARDQFCYDADGNEYLDFFGGIVTVSVGHGNPAVKAAVARQMDKLTHVSTCFATEPMLALAEKLAAISPMGASKVFFTNSGTEAVETAILTARMYTGHSDVIALRHGYHGRSALAMALTGHANWRLGPDTQPAILRAASPYCYRCPFGLSYPDCGVRCARDVEELIQTSSAGGKVAAMIAEPIQGVGGFITPPPEYFAIVADIVRRHGGVFISDEVQTAWGRTGTKWFGIEHWGVQPDLLVSAKGLGNGLPIGVTMARAEVADAYKGPTISTFGGNPLATAAGSAVLAYIEDKQLRQNTQTVGAQLKAGLEALQRKHPLIGEVRGIGLLLAMELVRDRASKEPAAPATNALLAACRDQRVLVGKGGLYGNVIRISPPMNIGAADVEEFLRRMDRALTQVKA